MPIQPRPFQDVRAEWETWQRNTNRPMPLADYARFMDAREGAPLRQNAYSPTAVQNIWTDIQETVQDPMLVQQAALRFADPSGLTGKLVGAITPKPDAPVSEYTSEMGGKALSLLDLVAPDTQIENAYAAKTGIGSPYYAPRDPTDFERVGRDVGRAVPSMAQQAPLFAAGGPGLALASLVSGLDAYVPQGDVASGLITAAMTPVGAKAVPAGALMGERAALRSITPAAESFVNMPAREYGTAAAGMLRGATEPGNAAVVQAGRALGGIGAGVAVGETQRQAERIAHGESPNLPSAEELAGEAAGTGAFAVPLLKSMRDPYAAMQLDAADVLTRAQRMRTESAQSRQQWRQATGQRLAAAHSSVFDAVRRGEDPTKAIALLKDHWTDRKAGQLADVTPEEGFMTLKSIADDANMQGALPNEAFHRIVAGVQGRFNDLFAQDRDRTPYDTIDELARRNLMPKLTKEWIEQNFGDAVDQMLGDYEGAKVNLINRIVAHYEEVLPGALEAMRAQKVPEGLSRQQLNAQSEADKDAAYMNAILQLYPHMKDAKDARGGPLADAFYQKDIDFSNQTQGGNTAQESGAWARYDAWKDAVIKMAQTYDPNTRLGDYFPARRLSDGTMLELPGQKVSLEEMVKPDFTVTAKRKMNRAQGATALRDAIELVNERFGSEAEADPENPGAEPLNVPEKMSTEQKRQLMPGENPDLQRAAAVAATPEELMKEAQDAGLDEKAAADYVANASEANSPALGVDLEATNSESYYDVALYLMNKVDKLTNPELWQKYGGATLFGKGAKSPGKFELFKDAVMAKLESAMDDSGKLTVAQTRFTNAWRAKNNLPPLSSLKSWEEIREARRHAERLYWHQVTQNRSFPEFFMSMLDDKPKYRALLGKAQGGEQMVKSRVTWPTGKQSIAHEGQPALFVAENGQQALLSREPGEIGALDYKKQTNQPWRLTYFDQNGTPLGHETYDSWRKAYVDVGNGTAVKNWQERPVTQSRIEPVSSSNAPAVRQRTGLRDPVADSIRLFRGFGRQLGMSAEGSDQAAIIAGNLAANLDEVGGVAKLVNEDPTTQGTSTAVSAMSGPLVGVNFDAIRARERGPFVAMLRALQVFGHELGHNYSAHSLSTYGDIFRRSRLDAYENLNAAWEELGPQAANEFVNEVIPQIMLPQWMNEQMSRPDITRQDFRQEATSRLMEFALLGAFTRDNPWQSQQLQKSDSWMEATLHLPPQMVALMNFAFRDVLNFGAAIKQYYKSIKKDAPHDKKVLAFVDHIMDNARRFIDTTVPAMRESETLVKNMAARMTASGSVAWGDPAVVVSAQRLDDKKLYELANENKIAMTKAIDPKATQMGFENLQGPLDGKIVFEHEKRSGVPVPTWSRYASLFYQTMLRFHKQGNPLAETIMYRVNDLEKAYFRLTRYMHEPFLVTDEQGRLKYDPEHPMLKVVQQDTPTARQARGTLSEIARKMNEEQLAYDDPKMKSFVEEKLRKYDGPTQQGVLEGLKSLVRAHQSAADLVYNDRVEATGVRLGGLLMTTNRTMPYDQAFTQGKTIVAQAIAWESAKKKLNALTQQIQKLQQKPNLPMEGQQQVAAMAADIRVQQAEVLKAQQAYNTAMVGLDGDQIGATQRFLFGQPDQLATALVNLNDFFGKRAPWFTTETRPGRIFIVSQDRDNVQHYNSARDQRHAKEVTNKLTQQGHTSFRYVDRQAKNEAQAFDAPDAVIDSIIDLENKSWQTVRHALANQLSTEDLEFVDSLGYVPGEAAQKALDLKGIKRYMQQRELKPGRENVDSIEAFTDYSKRLSGSVARRGLRREIQLMMRDPRLRNQDDFKAFVQENVDSLMQPLNQNLQAVRSALTARFLGLPNVVSPLVEQLQIVQGVLPYFVDQAGFVKGHEVFGRALTAPAKLSQLGKTLESKRLLQSAVDQEQADPRKMTKEQSLALYYKRQNDEGGFQYGPIYSAAHSRDHELLVQQAFGLGTTTDKSARELVSDKLYWASQMSMSLYSFFSGNNSRIAFAGALDLLYDKGLRGQQLFQAAAAYQNLFVHGGGKPNSIGYVAQLSNPRTRSFWGLTDTLQRYAFGSTTMLKDWFDEVAGRMDVPKAEQRKAAQAMSTALFWQVMLGGAMGITGMGIMAALVQKFTGFDAKQKMRELWFELSKRLGADDALAATLANYAQNGAVSNALGIDVSNRLSTNNIVGFNAYDGFNSNEMMGVVSGTVGDLIDATKFVGQGKYVQAGKSLLPPSMRPYLDLAESQYKFGDFALRDQAQRMQTPLTGSEATAYALGLRPQRYRHLKDQLAANLHANTAYNDARDQKLDSVARDLESGNVQSTLELVQQLRKDNPTLNPQSTVRGVIDRAVEAGRPVDPLASGPAGTEAERVRIAQTFGNVQPRQSELQDAIKREQLNARTGYMGGKPQTPEDFDRALEVDALVQSTGMPRSEAVRLIELMRAQKQRR